MIAQYFITIGFHMADADHSLYVEKIDPGIVIITIYVDDLIIGGDALEDVEHVKALLHKQFDMKDLGELHYFLVIEMIRNESGILLSQKKYGLDMLMKIVGCLIYMMLSHPDLSYAVGLSYYIKFSGVLLLATLKRISQLAMAASSLAPALSSLGASTSLSIPSRKTYSSSKVHVGLNIRCARVGGVEIPNSKRIETSLQYVHGIGRTKARQILLTIGLLNKVTKELSEEELTSIREEITKNPKEYKIEGDLFDDGEGGGELTSNIPELVPMALAIATSPSSSSPCQSSPMAHLSPPLVSKGGIPCDTSVVDADSELTPTGMTPEGSSHSTIWHSAASIAAPPVS
ncbi:hypothetical protein L7F22_050446 [Adiantum nelumboides]|nr:hypothetical protein [Adiantum nelumboides]